MLKNIDGVKKSNLEWVKDPSSIQNKIVKDETDFHDLRGNLVSDNESTYIVDSQIIKGVSPHRHENDSNFDYVLMKNKDNEGMRFYMHKYFTGHMHYYQHLKFQQIHERLLKIMTA